MSNSKKGLRKSPEHIKKLRDSVNRFWADKDAKQRRSIVKPRIGKDSPWWRGGISDLNTSIRKLTECTVWKQKVRERDGFICQICGIESKPGKFILMHVDHIVPLSYLIKVNNITSTQKAIDCESLWEISNGRVLCKPCHVKTDTYSEKAKDFEIIN